MLRIALLKRKFGVWTPELTVVIYMNWRCQDLSPLESLYSLSSRSSSLYHNSIIFGRSIEECILLEFPFMLFQNCYLFYRLLKHFQSKYTSQLGSGGLGCTCRWVEKSLLPLESPWTEHCAAHGCWSSLATEWQAKCHIFHPQATW